MRTLMRWLVRLVFLAVLVVGLLLGIVYPWGAEQGGGYELGRWRVFDRDTGFVPVETSLPTNEDQIVVVAELATEAEVTGLDRTVVLTMTASAGGRTEIAHAFTLDGVEPRVFSPQLPSRFYRLQADTLFYVSNEPYIFTFGPGEADIPMVSVDLVLIGGTYPLDESVPPIGYGMIAVGFVGLVLSLRRRRENPNSQPPPPRWGRG